MDTGSIQVTGSHVRGYRITGWIDGHTEAVIQWCGFPDGEVYSRRYKSERETLNALDAIDGYVNLRLVSATLLRP